MRIYVDEQAVEQFLQGRSQAQVRCSLPGDEALVLTSATLAHVRECVLASGWYAAPRLIVFDEPVRPLVYSALEHALDVERGRGYRRQERKELDTTPRGILRVEYYGTLDEMSSESGWIDIAVVLTSGETYMFTVETMGSLQTGLVDDAEPSGSYYCPDLLVVCELRATTIEHALSELLQRGIWNYGILADDSDTDSTFQS